MQISGWIAATFLLASSALSINPIPFDSPITASPDTNKRAYDVLQLLRKRDGNCPGGYNACGDLDNPDICCRSGSRCTSDEANHIACCPTGASCTGTIGAGSTSGNFDSPTPTGNDDAQVTGSTIDGAYPFVAVPSTFSDADQCSSYYDRCESDYTSCVTYFGGWGVTVTGGGADFTQGGGAARETCSSLSQSACHGLSLGDCGNYEGGQDGASARRTTSLQDLVVGMVIGIAGFFI
ncbi:uncharacterized protein BDV17DRAFT_286740 [Aspergillus undulatus]|uniref:uncharacterized protein n=1 Tax=Aspergillus undulatus TaxID=1810928 RepID=UPI003CCE1EAE